MTRDEALADLIRNCAHAQRIVERLARNYPKDLDVASLQLAMEYARDDLVKLRHSFGRPQLHALHIRKARDWAKLKRRQVERIKRETAARLRIDPAGLPGLVLP